jgi:flagellar hook-basal body complex protein FliE
MINLNADVVGAGQAVTAPTVAKQQGQPSQTNFAKFLEKCVSQADSLQQQSDEAIQQLLTGRNQDINSVVAAVAKADISFKLLVNVRNKIIEAYKQTMNMQL